MTLKNSMNRMKTEDLRKLYLKKSKINVGLGQAKNLLRFHEPFAYVSSLKGWNYDAYDINGILITVGQSLIGKTANPYLLKEYDNRAETLYLDTQLDDDVCQQLIESLLKEYIEKELYFVL